MKKCLAILLFSTFCHGQSGLIARQNFGYKSGANIAYNTFIGGVASAINTPALLATKLGISAGTISNFTVVGSDIKCKITGGYAILNSCFANDTSITYYTDSDNLVHTIGTSAFGGTTNIAELSFNGNVLVKSACIGSSAIKRVLLPNSTTIEDTAFQNATATTVFYIPRTTILGLSALNNNVFQGTNPVNFKVYAHPSLATNNAGSRDGDLTGLDVSFVSDFTPPNAITTLASGTIYNTAIQLNFTPPSAINAIDYYELYKNGAYYQRINPGEYATGLTASTSYDFTVIAVDVFYNKSTVSNLVSASTANVANSNVPTSGLVSYYKLDEISGTTANDSFGSEHLTNTGVSVNQTGVVGKSYLSTANSQKATTATISKQITGSFSVNVWAKRTTNSADYGTIFDQGTFGTGFGIWHDPSYNLSWRINSEWVHFTSLANLPLNTWVMITVVYNGTSVKIYINSVEKKSDVWSVNPTSATSKNLFLRPTTAQTFVGGIDEVSVYNTALNQTEINAHYNAGLGITL